VQKKGQRPYVRFLKDAKKVDLWREGGDLARILSLMIQHSRGKPPVQQEASFFSVEAGPSGDRGNFLRGGESNQECMLWRETGREAVRIMSHIGLGWDIRQLGNSHH
jgi:hypothetical protein